MGGGGVGGVTGLPGCDLIRHNLLFPQQRLLSPSMTANPPPPSPSSLTARKQDHDTTTLAVDAPCVSRVHRIHVQLPKQSRAKTKGECDEHESKTHRKRGKTAFCNFQHKHTLKCRCKIKICLHTDKQSVQSRTEILLPVATEMNRMKAGTELSVSCVFVGGGGGGLLRLLCTSSRLSGGWVLVSVVLPVVYAVGLPGTWCRSRGWGRVSGAGRVAGLGFVEGWINTADTKGLGSRDLLFSSTLPSISLNPRPHYPPPPPPFTALSRTLLWEIWRWGWEVSLWGSTVSFHKHVVVSSEERLG